MTPVEALWLPARNRHGQATRRSNDLSGVQSARDRRRPSPGITAVLLVLEPAKTLHGSEIARRSGQDQGNVTARWLPRLKQWGFVDVVDTVPTAQVRADKRGGRPTVTWRLTARGRELVAVLRAEREVA